MALARLTGVEVGTKVSGLLLRLLDEAGRPAQQVGIPGERHALGRLAGVSTPGMLPRRVVGQD